MTPTVKHSLRIPVDLRAEIAAEAERLGHPHTFSSVAVNAMRAGLDHSHNPQHNTTPESLRAKRAVTTKPYESAAEAAAAGFKRKPPTAREGPTEARPKGKKG